MNAINAFNQFHNVRLINCFFTLLKALLFFLRAGRFQTTGKSECDDTLRETHVAGHCVEPTDKQRPYRACEESSCGLRSVFRCLLCPLFLSSVRRGFAFPVMLWCPCVFLVVLLSSPLPFPLQLCLAQRSAPWVFIPVFALSVIWLDIFTQSGCVAHGDRAAFASWTLCS